jgi:signal transduction histidine kinase
VQVRTAELRGAEAQLVETARRAGMAEIATNVLHNVGNGLNSVNVSVNLVSQKVRGSRSPGLTHAVALMRAHRDDLGDFLTTDDRGRQLPDYLDKLATTLQSERESLDDELLRLTQGVSYVKEIVNAQQSLAGVTSVIEPVLLTELADTALRMAGVLADDAVTVARELPDGPPLSLDRHRLLLVLLNLLSNATRAMARNDDRPSLLTLRAEITTDPQGPAVSLRVTDNGEGISAENLTQIFVHGFTTHDDGHGFGLHSAALAAQEMGGTLTAHSAGPGTGAAFTLEVPLERPGASS